MKSSTIGILLVFSSLAFGGSSSGRKALEIKCTMSTGVCKATFDATLAAATTSRNCGGSVGKWSMLGTDGAILTQEIEKAVINHRFATVVWDDTKCFDTDTKALKLTGIFLDLSKAAY